jgi:hypothetical protein
MNPIVPIFLFVAAFLVTQSTSFVLLVPQNSMRKLSESSFALYVCPTPRESISFAADRHLIQRRAHIQ